MMVCVCVREREGRCLCAPTARRVEEDVRKGIAIRYGCVVGGDETRGKRERGRGERERGETGGRGKRQPGNFGGGRLA